MDRRGSPLTSQLRTSTTCVIGDREAVSLEWCMHDYLRHLKHHVEQIERG